MSSDDLSPISETIEPKKERGILTPDNTAFILILGFVGGVIGGGLFFFTKIFLEVLNPGSTLPFPTGTMETSMVGGIVGGLFASLKRLDKNILIWKGTDIIMLSGWCLGVTFVLDVITEIPIFHTVFLLSYGGIMIGISLLLCTEILKFLEI